MRAFALKAFAATFLTLSLSASLLATDEVAQTISDSVEAEQETLENPGHNKSGDTSEDAFVVEASEEGSAPKEALLTPGPSNGFPKRDITADLARLETSLQSISETLSALKSQTTPATTEGAKNSFVKNYAAFFVQCLEERTVELQKGWTDLTQFLQSLFVKEVLQNAWLAVGSTLLMFAFATLLGVGGAMVARWWLRRLLSSTVFKWAMKELEGSPRLQKTFSFVAHFLVALLPVLLLAILQVASFSMLEGGLALRNAMLSFAVGLFLWVGIWRAQEVLFQYLPLSLLNPGAQKRKRTLLSSLRFFLFFWVVDEWIINLLGFAALSRETSILVMLCFGLGLTVSAMNIVQALRQPLLRWIKSTQERQFPLLTTLFWMFWNTLPIVLYVLFVVDELLFERFFLPLVLTTFLLPMIPVLYLSFRRLRIFYVMAHRHDLHKTLLFRWLRPKTAAYRFFYLVTYGVVSLLIIEVWDLKFFYYLKFTLGSQVYEQLADFALLVFGAWLSINFGDRVLRYYLDPRPLRMGSDSLYRKGRMRTLLMILRTVLRVSIFIVFSLTILSKLQYNITPIITNLGIASAVLGFGLQSFVKDFFAGLFSLLDNNVLVGDWVDIDGKLGIVEELTLRTIKMRADNGTLMTIPFGNIKVIGNRSRHFSRVVVNVPVPYTESVERIQKIMERAYQALRKNSLYRKKLEGQIQIRGINEIRDYALIFQARIQTMPAEQEFVRRGYNRALKEILDEEGIKVPTPPYPIVRDKLSTHLTPTPLVP